MTAEKIHRVANIGRVILGGIVLAVEVVGLFRGRRSIAKPNAGTATTA